MSNRSTNFGALVTSNPAQAARDLARAYYKVGGTVPLVAEELGISVSSYHRLKRVLGVPKVPPMPPADGLSPVVDAARALIEASDDAFDSAWEALEKALS